MGERPPGTAGACLNCSIVAGVLKIPFKGNQINQVIWYFWLTLGEVAAILAASPYWPEASSC
jgi:hypothetical protein